MLVCQLSLPLERHVDAPLEDASQRPLAVFQVAVEHVTDVLKATLSFEASAPTSHYESVQDFVVQQRGSLEVSLLFHDPMINCDPSQKGYCSTVL